MKRILLTGGTGFVGGHLAYALLQSGQSVVLLVRPAKTGEALARVRRQFEHLDVYSGSRVSTAGDVEGVEGDIRERWLGLNGGVTNRALRAIDEVWHCAALPSFDESRREEIESVNVLGCRNVIETAQACGIRRFHYTGTAYVAGAVSGTAFETSCTGNPFRNSYERTKCQAELDLLDEAAAGRLDPTIYRLGIVVGHSRTGEATAFNGYYNLARAFYDMRRKRFAQLCRTAGVTGGGAPAEAGEVRLPVRIPCASGATLNLVTIDFVTRVLLELAGNSKSIGKIVHVTNTNPVNGRDLWRWSLDHLGITGYEFVESIAEMEDSLKSRPDADRFEKAILRYLASYASYLGGEPKFDTTNARLLGVDIRHRELNRSLVARLMEYAVGVDFGRKKDAGDGRENRA